MWVGGSVQFPLNDVSEKSHDGRQPSSDISGSNDKDSSLGSGSDTDGISLCTSNDNSCQSQVPEDKQAISVRFLRFLVGTMICKELLATDSIETR